MHQDCAFIERFLSRFHTIYNDDAIEPNSTYHLVNNAPQQPLGTVKGLVAVNQHGI